MELLRTAERTAALSASVVTPSFRITASDLSAITLLLKSSLVPSVFFTQSRILPPIDTPASSDTRGAPSARMTCEAGATSGT